MRYVFADEAGCLVFAKKNGVSRYFILCTVATADPACGGQVLSLRRDLAWRGHNADVDKFHATEDSTAVRSEMFALLESLSFRVDATIYEKSKSRDTWRASSEAFYKLAWYYHLKFTGPRVVDSTDNRMLIQAASIGPQKRRKWFLSQLNDVGNQSLPGTDFKCTFWPSASDPCLQIADYCAWAIQRKWERGESEWYDRIRKHVASEYDMFRSNKNHAY